MKNKYFVHFVLYILDICFRYLHKRFDVYYDLENECHTIFDRGDIGEK